MGAVPKRDDMRKHLNKFFTISAKGDGAPDPVEMELTEVTDLPAPPEDIKANPEPYSMIFRAPREADLPQATYSVSQDDFDELHMFIVPLGPTKSGDAMEFQVIFN